MSQNRSSEVTVLFADRRSRGWRMGLGLVTLFTGVLILVWPGMAVVTVAIIVGIHLIAAGLVRGVTAFTGDTTGGLRVLYVLLGLLLGVAGILCLVEPFHAIALLVVLFGVSWLVNGVVEVFHGVTGGGGWTVVSGAVSIVAGIVVLVFPAPTARALVWLFGLTLLGIGLTVFIVATFGDRRTGQR